MFDIKQSTSRAISFFAHDVNGDAVNSLADGTWTKTISKNGGALAAMTVTITFDAGGWYTLTLSTSHTDTLGQLVCVFTNAGCKQVNLLFNVSARVLDNLAYPATSGRSMVVDAAGLVDANAVKVGPTGSGTAQTARDLGLALPAVAPAANGGLPTVNASNQVAGVSGNVVGSVASVTGDVAGKVLGGGAGAITATGAWVLNAAGAALAPAATALTNATWTDAKAGYLTGSVALDSTVAKEATLNTKIPTALSFTGVNVNADSKVTAAPTDMALNSTVAKDATVAKEATLATVGGYIDTEIGDIQSRLPAALVGGRMSAYVGAMAAGVVDAAAAPNLDAAVSSRSTATVAGLKKNTAQAAFMFVMYDSADHVTPKTLLAITAQRSLDGGAFGACINAAAEIGSGVYKIDLAAADLNADTVMLKFTAAGGDARYILVVTNE